MVEHEHRFLDRHKYIFERPESFTLVAIPTKSQLARLGLEGVVGFTYLHPVRGLREGRMPRDLSLKSRDCLLLWQAMKKFENHKRSVPPDLTPYTFFNADIITLDGRLKSLLTEWMKSVRGDLSTGAGRAGKERCDKGWPFIAPF